MIKKIIIALGLLIFISIASYLAYTFLIPTENGKQYVENIVSKTKNTATPCVWSGFVKHKKVDELQVFLGCDIISILKNNTISNQNELTDIVHKKAITPFLSEFPAKSNVYITYIAQVKENAVICVDIKNKNIVNTYYDSYDNYCWPN